MTLTQGFDLGRIDIEPNDCEASLSEGKGDRKTGIS
jgi:hypothetical protein